jgi:dipeptidyl aminopeptidase/acylaminoacyl peptidase
MSHFKIIILLISQILTIQPLHASTPKFVSAELLYESSLKDLRTFTSGFGQRSITNYLRYGVKTYKLIYKTHYKGEEIEASGIIYVPSGIASKAPIISLQHGTTFVKDDVPSMSAGQFAGIDLFASAGFIAIMPDFIGYGESSEVFHPYYDKHHSALTVIDMVKAAKQFLKKENVLYSEDLFLAGYSEGGYVTLAAAEEIESNRSHQLSLNGVAAGAGGYDLTGMLKGVTTQTNYTYPSYLAFVLMSYNTTYDWNRPLSEFFQDEYAQALKKFMNGKHDGWYINQRLTTKVAELFNEQFFQDLRNSTKELSLKNALRNNSVFGWKTKTPVNLYHGTRDEIIPFANSESTLKSFVDAGAVNVSLKTIPGGTHGSSFLPMMQAFIPWFVSLADLEQ